MVRKSERNKSQSAAAAVATPEKASTDRGRKSTRQPRRRKKSSSDSDHEADGHVEKETKEVGEISESKTQSEAQDDGPESKQDGAKSRRSTRRQQPPLPPQPEKVLQVEKNSEWKEDPGFWGSEESAPVAAEASTPEEGTTWKIQSSNGSGGEIQKLKICRQRVTDSSDSSSPAHAKDTLSPRRKKSKSSKNIDESAESGGDTPSNQNETKEDSKSDSASEEQSKDKEPTKSEVSKDDANVEHVERDGTSQLSEKEKEPKLNDAKKSHEPRRSRRTSESNKVSDHKSRKGSIDVKEGASDKALKPIPESKEECIVEAQEPPQENTKDSENINMQPSTETEDEKSSNTQKESTDSKEILPEVVGEASTEVEVEIPAPVEDTLVEVSEPAKEMTSVEVSAPVEKSSSDKVTVPDEDASTDKGSTPVEDAPKKSPSEEHVAEEASHIDETAKDDKSVEEISSSDSKPSQETKPEVEKKVESRERTKSETSDDGKSERKTITLSKVKVPVNSEVAMDEIAKKLNERAARFSKDSNDNSKEQKRESIESIEPPKSPREEGELTPTPEQMRKSKHTTIVINKPKEVTSQPTRLKRNTDELPPTERKRRILLKSKSKDKEEDPINISSQSLMLLVPEVKTITPEQVATFPLDDDDLTKIEAEQSSPVNETKIVKKKKIDLKAKEVEIRVENDTRQVIKKKPIVIESKDSQHESKTVGPKLPTQENHRVVRKISLVNEEVKKPRRSPSPGGKSPTEVLFITNLVRPFTVPQLRELLARTGTIAQNGFYIDKIKSKCYVKYTDVEMAVETRHALNGVRWPVNNPKTLKVEFATAEDMSFVQRIAEDEIPHKKTSDNSESVAVTGWLSEQAALKPQRRVTTAVREWDMGKVGAGQLEEKKPDDWRGSGKQTELVDQKRRPISPVDPKFEAPPRKIKKRDNDAPARLLDDLFRKTKATPCIYWLPLTAAQIAVKEEMRRQHVAEHERRLAELRKTDHARRDKDREKSRDRRKK